jgi:hypothetical protein
MILDKIDKIGRDGVHVFSGRGTAMTDPNGTVYCIAKFYNSADLNTQDVFVISVHQYPSYHKFRGQLHLEVKGPYEDSSDDYWIACAEHDKNRRAIITEDWTHRTVSKDVRDRDLAGHGGAEFRFKVNQETAERFEAAGLKVDSERADGTRILTTRNVWYQGVIPPKHRHLFKVNAEMVQGFNPGRNI